MNPIEVLIQNAESLPLIYSNQSIIK